MTNFTSGRATSLARPASVTLRITSSKSLYAAGASSFGYLRQLMRMSRSSKDGLIDAWSSVRVVDGADQHKARRQQHQYKRDAYDNDDDSQHEPLSERDDQAAAAGRRLFAASRARRGSSNDADRFRKYLARFGLDWRTLKSSPSGGA